MLLPLLFRKYADEFPLSDYQRRVSERLQQDDVKGLIAAHGVGSGKTRTSIEALKQLNQPADIVVPAALIPNWQKELNRWQANDLPITFHTIEKLQRSDAEPLTAPVLVGDEIHRLRNAGKAYKAFARSRAKKKLFLTGTPMVNRPSDLLPALRLISNDRTFKVNRKTFDSIIDDAASDTNDEPITGKLNKEELKTKYNNLEPNAKRIAGQRLIDALKRHVDVYMKPPADMPTAVVQDVIADANKRQNILQAALRGRLNAEEQEQLKQTLAPHRQELDKLKAFRIGERQLANGDTGFMNGQTSPKMDAAVENFLKEYRKDKKHKAVIYSNFVRSGLDLYKQRLTEANVPFGEFTGQVSRQERNKAVDDYNADKLNALLISGAGAEGINLRGSNAIHITEPHFTESRSIQAIARAIRKGSHNHLPVNQRTVNVLRYYLNNPQDPSADTILDKMSKKKQKAINFLLQKLQQTEQ